MGIVDYGYYTSTYMGDQVDGSVFPPMEAKAERLIIQITHGRAADVQHLPPAIQIAVKNAICAQIEYYNLVGLDVSIAGDTASEWTVGKVHVNSGAKASATGAVSMVCPAAIAELEQTGLLNPSVPAFGYLPPFRGVWP